LVKEFPDTPCDARHKISLNIEAGDIKSPEACFPSHLLHCLIDLHVMEHDLSGNAHLLQDIHIFFYFFGFFRDVVYDGDFLSVKRFDPEEFFEG
jgi:hypothetical protein